MNSENIEPDHEDLGTRIERDFGHLIEDQDDTSGQATPERDGTNHLEFPPKQSNGRLPKHSLDTERQLMRFQKHPLRKK